MTILLLRSPVLLVLWSGWLALGHNETDIHEGTWGTRSGAALCGEHEDQVTPSGECRLVATLPRLGKQQCPDIFRCTHEVDYWLHENEERKRQMADLKETISELQEELRNHRHRINILELQNREKSVPNSSLEFRLAALEQRHAQTGVLLRAHGALVYDARAQLRNLSILAEETRRGPACVLDGVHASPPTGSQEEPHPVAPNLRSCPIDCASLYYNGVHRSGLYVVMPSSRAVPVEVFCDMESEGGGWTVIQRRQDGSVNFNRGWREYREGFGNLQGEFWLGNEHIHELSNQGDYALRIDLEDWKSKRKHALYGNFRIDNEESRYRLHVSGFSGTVEDSFSWYHDKQSFSTPDTGNLCADISHAGWWYHQCFFANLNGVYYTGGRYSAKAKNLLGPDGIVWHSWKDSDYYSLKKASMMIRPRTFRPRLSP